MFTINKFIPLQNGISIAFYIRFGALWMPPVRSQAEDYCPSSHSGYHWKGAYASFGYANGLLFQYGLVCPDNSTHLLYKITFRATMQTEKVHHMCIDYVFPTNSLRRFVDASREKPGRRSLPVFSLRLPLERRLRWF